MYNVKFSFIDHMFKIDPILTTIKIGNFELPINWYGFFIAVGFLLAIVWALHVAKKWHMDIDKLTTVVLISALVGIIGARLYYVIFNWEYYEGSFLDIIAIWNGGLAIYGGIIGGVLAAYVCCKALKLNFLNVADIAVMGFLIGQGLGRWGNFTNQEAFGCNTTLPWGMYSEATESYLMWNQAELLEKGITVDPSMPVHPTFLYESLWCVIGFVILLVIYKKFRKFSGQLALTYGVWYGIGRTIFEGLRTDSLYLWNTNIRVSQLLSFVIAVACAAALVIMLVKVKKQPKPIEGIDYYYPIKTIEELKAEDEQKKLERKNKK